MALVVVVSTGCTGFTRVLERAREIEAHEEQIVLLKEELTELYSRRYVMCWCVRDDVRCRGGR